MKKASKFRWIGILIGTICVLAVLNFLDVRVFNQLNPFYKKPPKASEEFNIKGTQTPKQQTPVADDADVKTGLRPEFLEYMIRETDGDTGSTPDVKLVHVPDDIQAKIDAGNESIENSQLMLARIEARTPNEEMKRIHSLNQLTDAELLSLAKGGEPAAQSFMGARYYRGTEDTPKNVNAAIDWTWKAAKNDYALAYENLYAMVGHSSVKTSVRTKVRKWIQSSAEAGDVKAQAFLGKALYYGSTGIEKDKTQAVKWLEVASEGGNPQAQVLLAFHIMLSLEPEDDARGVEWLKKAAVQGSGEGQYDLAKAYEYGEGVDKDPLKALSWYEVAAMKGFPGAQKKLMMLHFDTESPARDDDKARAYAVHILETDKTDQVAYYVIGELYRAGRSYPQDFDKARENLEKSSDFNYGKAQMVLAEMYLNGEGVTPDRDKAIQLLRRSAKNFHTPAKTKLRDLGEVVE